MGTTGRVVGILLLVTFVSIIALRPLLSSPAVTATLSDGLSTQEMLLFLPLVVLAAVLAILSVRTVVTDEEAVTYTRTERRPDSEGWSVDRESGDESAGDSRDDSNRPSMLAGQGGTRDWDFEIEEEPPESGLDLHLEHLREELGEDESLRADLDTLESVVEQEGSEKIPGRCPQDHCEARWTEPGILGVGSGRYEVIDDGRKALCLECEAVVTLEDGEDRERTH